VMHWWQLPVHALLLQGLVPNETQRLYFVAWTLGIEAIFYALVPIAAALVRRANPGATSIDRLGAGVLALWAASVAVGIGLSLAHPFSASKAMPAAFTVLYAIPPLGNFCPGLLVFLALTPAGRARTTGWWERGRRLCAGPKAALTLAAVCWVLSQKLHWETDPLAYAAFYPLVGVASGLVLGSVLSGAWLPSVRTALAPIGLVSYGVYLWHWVLLAVLIDHTAYPVSSFGAAASVIHALVLLALTLPVALLSWLVIERPLLRRTTTWDRRTVSSREPAAPGVARPAPSAAAAGRAPASTADGGPGTDGRPPAESRIERPAARS
jgi:peptidoglycan/LPS O-acetylase OafA/YrhL